MQQEDFDAFLEDRFDHIRSVLAHKGSEYVADEPSRFHNFNTAAAFNDETPERALWGMLTKHLVSLSDMVKAESTDHPGYIWDEKIGDAINYLLLLWGMTSYHRDLAEGMVCDFSPENIPIHVNPYINSNYTSLGVEFNDY